MLLAQCRDTTPMGGIALFVSQAAWRSYRNASRLECKVWFAFLGYSFEVITSHSIMAGRRSAKARRRVGKS